MSSYDSWKTATPSEYDEAEAACSRCGDVTPALELSGGRWVCVACSVNARHAAERACFVAANDNQ